MLPEVCEQARNIDLTRLAVVLDVRTRGFFEQLPTMFADLSATGTLPEILFLEAADDVIVRRQESVRRPHPLQGDGRLLDGITRERETLATLRAAADLVIDTSSLNVHQLALPGDPRVRRRADDDQLRVTLLSFGFKNGIPVDADMVFDVRFLPNPHWIPELRPQTGLSKPVSDYVLRPGGRRGVPGHACRSCCPWCRSDTSTRASDSPRSRIGCTGGKHRSTAMAEEFARRLRANGHRRPRSCTGTWAGNERSRAEHVSGSRRCPGRTSAVGGRLRRRPRAVRLADRPAADHRPV